MIACSVVAKAPPRQEWGLAIFLNLPFFPVLPVYFMKIAAVKSFYNKQLDKLDHMLNDLEKLMEAYPTAHHAIKPSPAAWSATQVVQHLHLSERMAVDYLVAGKNKLESAPSPNLRSFYREKLLCLFLALPIKIKTPEIVDPNTVYEELPTQQIFEEWRQTRLACRSFLSEQPELYFKRLVFRHPYIGKMTVKGMLRFFGWHFNRHRKQLIRALESASGD